MVSYCHDYLRRKGFIRYGYGSHPAREVGCPAPNKEPWSIGAHEAELTHTYTHILLIYLYPRWNKYAQGHTFNSCSSCIHIKYTHTHTLILTLCCHFFPLPPVDTLCGDFSVWAPSGAVGHQASRAAGSPLLPSWESLPCTGPLSGAQVIAVCLLCLCTI